MIRSLGKRGLSARQLRRACGASGRTIKEKAANTLEQETAALNKESNRRKR